MPVVLAEQFIAQQLKFLSQKTAHETIKKHQLVLHSVNGGAMKGATMLATLQRLGVVPSPRVSDDNPYSKSLFKTLKCCPEYPSKPFAYTEEAGTQ